MMAQHQRDDLESDAEDTPLTVLFGSGARVRIVAALLGEDEHDVNVSDLARLAGVARSTVYEHIDELVALGVVERTRTVGGSPMYRLNRDSDVGQQLAKLEGVTLRRLLEPDGQLESE